MATWPSLVCWTRTCSLRPWRPLRLWASQKRRESVNLLVYRSMMSCLFSWLFKGPLLAFWIAIGAVIWGVVPYFVVVSSAECWCLKSFVSLNVKELTVLCVTSRNPRWNLVFLRYVEGRVGRASVGEHDFQEGASLRPGVHARWHWYAHLQMRPLCRCV